MNQQEIQKQIETEIGAAAFEILMQLRKVDDIAEKYKDVHPQIKQICHQILQAKTQSFIHGTHLIIDGKNLVTLIGEEHVDQTTKGTSEEGLSDPAETP